MTTAYNRVVVVGGSRGLGLQLSSLSEERGAEVLCIARHLDESSEHSFHRLEGDCSNESIILRAFEFKPDLLIFCAGSAHYGDLSCQSNTTISDQLQVNLAAPVLWLKAALQHLPHGGGFCHITSLTAIVGSREWSIYGAAKRAFGAIFEAHRDAFARREIFLMSAYPGPLQTNFHALAGAPNPKVAANARDVAKGILDACERRLPFFAAQCDLAVVTEYYGSLERMSDHKLS